MDTTVDLFSLPVPLFAGAETDSDIEYMINSFHGGLLGFSLQEHEEITGSQDGLPITNDGTKVVVELE